MERPHLKKHFLLRSILLPTLLLISVSIFAAMPWSQWKAVGQGQLTWAFWVIYDSELRTPTGSYSDNQQELVLIIDYRRDITKKALLEATGDQWQHLGIKAEQRTLWLKQLDSIWPDIQEGDQLAFVLTRQGGRFYQKEEPLGERLNLGISRAFIDIWLSPKTAYPELRKNLIGQ